MHSHILGLRHETGKLDRSFVQCLVGFHTAYTASEVTSLVDHLVGKCLDLWRDEYPVIIIVVGLADSASCSGFRSPLPIASDPNLPPMK